MNGQEIDFYLDRLRRDNKGEYGVYSADTIPERKYFPTGYIVNTDNSNSPGEHWVAFYYENPNKLAEYFDSYGFQPLRESFLRALPKRYKYSTHTIQGLFSVTCGEYCLYYLEKRANNYSMQEIISSFSTDPDWNDNRMLKYFKNKKRPVITEVPYYHQICFPKDHFIKNNKKFILEKQIKI